MQRMKLGKEASACHQGAIDIGKKSGINGKNSPFVSLLQQYVNNIKKSGLVLSDFQSYAKTTISGPGKPESCSVKGIIIIKININVGPNAWQTGGLPPLRAYVGYYKGGSSVSILYTHFEDAGQDLNWQSSCQGDQPLAVPYTLCVLELFELELANDPHEPTYLIINDSDGRLMSAYLDVDSLYIPASISFLSRSGHHLAANKRRRPRNLGVNCFIITSLLVSGLFVAVVIVRFTNFHLLKYLVTGKCIRLDLSPR